MPLRGPTPQIRIQVMHESRQTLVHPHLYDLRQTIRKALPDWPAQDIAVSRDHESLFVTALTPLGSAWLSDHLGRLMQALMHIGGAAEGPLVTVPDALVPGMEMATGGKGSGFAYRIGSLVVASRRQDWSPWGADQLPQAQQQSLAELINDDLRNALSLWLPDEAPASDSPEPTHLHSGLVRLVSEGRAMRITPERGPRGMARLDVSFVSRWRLQGAFFVGGMRQQGYGRVDFLGRAVWPSSSSSCSSVPASQGGEGSEAAIASVENT
jgi:hypothetical protein